VVLATRGRATRVTVIDEVARTLGETLNPQPSNIPPKVPMKLQSFGPRRYAHEYALIYGMVRRQLQREPVQSAPGILRPRMTAGRARNVSSERCTHLNSSKPTSSLAP
jgi:hypothetical protein